MTCTAWSQELVAYADHALDDHTREVIAKHVLHCEHCRGELAELRQVRSIVARADGPAAAPEDLARRLVAIAGPEAGRQLSLASDQPRGARRLGASRGSDNPGSGGRCRLRLALPSRRRARKVRLLAGTSMMLGLVGGCLGGVWLMAPDLPGVDDPEAMVLAQGSAAAALLGGPVTSSLAPCPERFSCPDQMDGLPLVALVVDSSAHPRAVRAEYSDGLRRIVVVQQHGRLLPAQSTAEASASTRQVWQSSDLVICVTAGEPTSTARAAQALPHERPAGGGVDRLRAGLRSLAGQRGR